MNIENTNEKWLMMQEFRGRFPIAARKLSAIIGFDYRINSAIIDAICTNGGSNGCFRYVLDHNMDLIAIEDLKAKSWHELLIALDLANCLFDEPRITRIP